MSALATILEMKPNTRRHRHYVGSDRPSFSVDQLKKFLDAAAKFGRREFAMFLTGFCHGMRASEIAEVRLSDIREDGKLHIERLKGSNHTNAKMQRAVGYDEAFVLARWLKERATWTGSAESDVVFLSQKTNSNGERKMDRSQVYRLFVSICKAAGIPKEFQHPHILRHTCGQLLGDNGMRVEELQQVLGHQSIASTGIYYKPSQPKVDSEMAKILKGLR